MLVRKLADSVMQPTAIKRLQNILQGNGTKITRETISSYLDYTNESYLTKVSQVNKYQLACL